MIEAQRCFNADLSQLLSVHYSRGADLIAMFELYLDETGTNTDAPVMAVSGYLFRKGARSKLEKQWDKILDDAGIGVFHMHEHKVPDGLKLLPGETDTKRKKRHDRMMRSLIRALVQRATAEVSVSLYRHDRFDRMVPNGFRGKFGGPYTMMIMHCLSWTVKWAVENSFHGKIAYFFESGHKEQAFVDHIMRVVESDQSLVGVLRYHSRSCFRAKDSSRALQSADLLAWEIQKFERLELGHEVPRINPRQSLRALIETKTERLDLNAIIPKTLPAFRGPKKWDTALIRKVVEWRIA